MDNTPYTCEIGNIIYVMVCNSPTLVYADGIVSQYMQIITRSI